MVKHAETLLIFLSIYKKSSDNITGHKLVDLRYLKEN